MPSAGLTTTERRVYRLLTERGPMTCTEIGAALWGRPTRKRQSYARPAGRILNALRRKGAVRWTRRGCTEYSACLWEALPQ